MVSAARQVHFSKGEKWGTSFVTLPTSSAGALFRRTDVGHPPLRSNLLADAFETYSLRIGYGVVLNVYASVSFYLYGRFE